MKKLSAKDFVIGFLTALLFTMLLGAGPDNNKVGRYSSSASNSNGWGQICVTDSLTGDTQCKTVLRKQIENGGVRDFSFVPDFSKN